MYYIEIERPGQRPYRITGKWFTAEEANMNRRNVVQLWGEAQGCNVNIVFEETL